MPELTIRLRNLAARPLLRNLTKVLSGNIAGNALAFVAYALLGRELTLEQAGLFFALEAPMLLLAQFSDGGLGTTIVKFYQEDRIAGRPNAAEGLLRRALGVRLLMVAVPAVPIILFAGPIALHYQLNHPAAATYLRIACLGSISISIWMYCQSAMQARQQFTAYAVWTTANHLLRLLLVVLLIVWNRLTVATALAVYVGVPLAGIAGAVSAWPREFWAGRAAQSRPVAEILRFSKWIFLSTIIASVILQLNTILLKLLSTEEQVALYRMAEKVAQGFLLLTAAVSTVMLPKIAGTRKREEVLRIGRMFMKSVPLLAAGTLLAIVLAHPLIPWILGEKYRPSLLTFDLLVISFALSIIINPISYFCLTFDRASWLTWMNLIQLALNVVVCLVLIPLLGALGAAIAWIVMLIFAVGFMAWAWGRLVGLAED